MPTGLGSVENSGGPSGTSPCRRTESSWSEAKPGHRREIDRGCRRIKDGAAASGELIRFTDEPAPAVSQHPDPPTSRVPVVPYARRLEDAALPRADRAEPDRRSQAPQHRPGSGLSREPRRHPRAGGGSTRPAGANGRDRAGRARRPSHPGSREGNRRMGPGIARTVAPRRALHRRFLPVAAPVETPPTATCGGSAPSTRASPRPAAAASGRSSSTSPTLGCSWPSSTDLSHRGARLPGPHVRVAGDPRPAGDAGALPGALPLEEAAVRRRLDRRALPGRRPLGLGRRAGRRRRVHRRLLPADPLGRPRGRLRRDGAVDRLVPAGAGRRRHPRRRLGHRRLDADVPDDHLPV